jgi:DUF177 domain-containing protein
MNVEINRISDNVLELSEGIDAEKWELDRDDLKFVGAIHIVATFKRVISGLDVRAQITAENDIICSRCQKDANKNFEYNFKRIYDLNKISGFLDIDEDVREEILLNFPMKVLCDKNCKGLCYECGADLNLNKCDCG